MVAAGVEPRHLAECRSCLASLRRRHPHSAAAGGQCCPVGRLVAGGTAAFLVTSGDEEKKEVVQARLYLNRRFSVDLRPTVALMLDDWNRTKLFPKAYTVLPDDGAVGVCAEHVFDFEAGATREQLKYTVGVWVDTMLRFAEWVDEQV